jgi:outer membrane protein TolC
VRKLDLVVFAGVALVAACRATVDPSGDYTDAQVAIREATGVEHVLRPDEPGLSSAEVERVLDGGLTLAEARQLALQQNRRLRAAFFEIGVSRADYEQSGLLRNPTLGLAYLWPDGGGRERIGADLVQGLSELWQLRFRRDFAEAELREKVASVAGQAARLAYEVERTYGALASVQAARSAVESEVQLAQDALVLMQRKVDVGVARSSELPQAQARLALAKVELQRLESAGIEQRRELASLLSLDGDPARLDVIELPGASAQELPAVERVLELASNRRLDLRAADISVARAEANVALERSRTTPDVALGIEWEHPEVGTNTPYVGGFNGSIEIPIFDQNIVQLRRAELLRDAAAELRDALRGEAEQDVRAAHATALAAERTLATLVEQAVPQAERAASLARKAYEVGHATALDLLDAQARRVATEKAVVEARGALARSRLELARASGGSLAPTP